MQAQWSQQSPCFACYMTPARRVCLLPLHQAAVGNGNPGHCDGVADTALDNTHYPGRLSHHTVQHEHSKKPATGMAYTACKQGLWMHSSCRQWRNGHTNPPSHHPPVYFSSDVSHNSIDKPNPHPPLLPCRPYGVPRMDTGIHDIIPVNPAQQSLPEQW